MSVAGPPSGEQAGTGGVAIPDLVPGILEPGEKVYWSGQPRPLRFMRSKAAHALFGMLAIVLLTMTPLRGKLLPLNPGSPPSVSGIPRQAVVLSVLVLAAYSIAVPFLAYRRARRTWYAVTDRRVLRVRRSTVELNAEFDDIGAPFLHALEDGTGDILFSRKPAPGEGSSPPVLGGIIGVPGVEEVHRALLRARQERLSRHDTVQDYLELLLRGRGARDLPDR